MTAASTFQSFEELCETLDDRSYDRPPVIVCNAHITALAVARSLHAEDVPVIALDRQGNGVAPYSEAVDCAGQVTYPLDDENGFREDVETIAAHLDHSPVVFPCMDEWALALARTDPDGVRFPFPEFETMNSVLDKSLLYDRAAQHDIPTPRTYRLDEIDSGVAADDLGFPLIVKPALKRRFEEAFGTNLVRVDTREQYHNILERAREAGIRVLAQEHVAKSRGSLYTLGSYVPNAGVDEAVTFIGNRRAIYPPDFGTTCLVERATVPAVEEAGLAILEASEYHGISEAEFLYDERREEYLLLDVNTRPWKWVGLPIAAGADLPLAAYADAVGTSYEPKETQEAQWVYLRDYLALLSNHSVPDELSHEDWLALLSGEFENRSDLTTAVHAPSDPGPLYQLLATEFSTREYYCAC